MIILGTPIYGTPQMVYFDRQQGHIHALTYQVCANHVGRLYDAGNLNLQFELQWNHLDVIVTPKKIEQVLPGWYAWSLPHTFPSVYHFLSILGLLYK